MAKKKFLGIFYKEWYMWLHYIPLVIVSIIITILTARIFGMPEIPAWYILIFLFFILYLGISITDQLVHALLSLFGVRD